ncbi:hypothetical protein DL93DRAFT_2082125 [Clavulina sp. PMI_390]|nr:hypothetical protein DL93DRAFT_2082125 [Clavulina sp. PMI_390]
MSDDEQNSGAFASSRLGTKAHWDLVYEKEVTNFEEFGDEGEVWFGEGSVEEMVDWCSDNLPPDQVPSCLDIGTGNGSLLFALVEAGYNPSSLHGIDYSEASVQLAQSIAQKHGEEKIFATFSTLDFLHQPAPPPPADANTAGAGWDLLLDKGTYDAIALAPSDDGTKLLDKYPPQVDMALKKGGFFLITCEFFCDA